MPHETLTEKARKERAEYQQRAYNIQLEGGLYGALRWTCYGILACGIAQYTWPFFRKQTWALKGFIVSSASIFGLVVGADDYLLQYESHLRRAENDFRRQARNALALQGRIATEGEIRKYREEQDEIAALAKAQESIPAATTGDAGHEDHRA